MPDFDMSDAFDADMFTGFTVLRREQIANEFGEDCPKISRFPGLQGVITAGDDNKIAIATDEQHQGKSISIVTSFRLRGVSKVGPKTFQPDLVQFNGDWFKVIVVEDYSLYGFGWIQAQATSEDFVDQAPPVGVVKSSLET